MNTGVFRKTVCDVHAQTIVLHCFHRWAMDLAIESPAMGSESRGKFVIDLFGNQMKNLHPIDKLVRECRPVRLDDRGVIFAGFARRELLGGFSLFVAGAFDWLVRNGMSRL